MNGYSGFPRARRERRIPRRQQFDFVTAFPQSKQCKQCLALPAAPFSIQVKVQHLHGNRALPIRQVLFMVVNVIRRMERRFIGLRTILESALVSHKGKMGNRTTEELARQKKMPRYCGRKFTRIKLTPIRNSVPSCSMAARTRSSS